jgi:beta-lactamase regulating signal transducer with metallopeptidase domain
MIGWLVEAVIASAVLMAIVLVVRGPVQRTFGPGIAYALWALPAIRLVLPPLPQLPAWRESTAPQLAQRASETITYYVIEPLGGSAVAAPTSSFYATLGLALAVLWGVGAVAFLLWHTFSHWRFCRRMILGSTHSERAGDVEVIETGAASGPLAFGIFRRYIAFPRDFAERYDAEERELALAHELGHHQRGDLIANWIALTVLAIHWFNPLAWRAFRAFRSDQEMANDARVLAGRNPIDRHTYACAIVKAAHGGAVSAACHLHTIQDLKGRLRMLTTGRRSRLRLTLGGTAVAALMIGGLATTASGTTAANSVRAGVEKATGIDIAKLDAKLQSTPAAPAAPGAADDQPLPPPPGPPSAALPPAPPADPDAGEPGTVVVTKNADGKKVVKRVKFVRLGKNGEVMNENYQDLRDIPEISSGSCDPGGKGKRPGDEMVVNKTKGDKRVLIICTDRIDRVVSMNVATAVNAKDIQRKAFAQALAGLHTARARIAGNASMTSDQKKEALAGIDEAIRGMESDQAKAD